MHRIFQRVEYLPEALKLVWSSARGWALGWAALLVVSGVLPAVNVYVTKVLVDRIDAATSLEFAWETLRWVLVPAAAMALVFVLEQALRSLLNWVRSAQSEYVADHVKELVHSKAGELDLEFYDSPDYYDHMARANSEAGSRTTSMLQSAGSTIQDAVTILSIAGLLVTYGIWVPLVLILSAIPSLYVVVRYNQKIHDWWKASTPERRWATYFDQMLTRRESAPEIRIFGLAGNFRQRYVDLRTKLRNEGISIAARQALASIGAGLSGLLVMAGSLGWMLWRALHGLATLGDLALFYQAFNKGQSLMSSMLSNLGRLFADTLFLEHLVTFLRLEPKVANPDAPQPLPNPPRREIALRGVTFRYPGTETNVLENFSLTLPIGKTVAIVGPNGAGKSTLINLLCRFYDPVEGRIEIDGADLRDVDLHELRRAVTVMFQFPVRWAATAEENIMYGDLLRDVNEESVSRAAANAGASSIIESLPHKYETLLSRQFTDGMELSGGEWQRVSLARAFFRQAPIVILDEPTSSMDSWEEARWLRRFRRLVEDRTALIVTHRFTTAMRADIIHVMEDGHIVESGSHAELLALNGRYAESWYEQTASQGSYQENGHVRVAS